MSIQKELDGFLYKGDHIVIDINIIENAIHEISGISSKSSSRMIKAFIDHTYSKGIKLKLNSSFIDNKTTSLGQLARIYNNTNILEQARINDKLKKFFFSFDFSRQYTNQ